MGTEQDEPTLRQLAVYLGLGALSAAAAWTHVIRRENMLRAVQDALETHKSDAPTPELAAFDRIRYLRSKAVADAHPEEPQEAR